MSAPSTPVTQWETRLCDNLEKVFQDTEPRAMDTSIGYSVLLGESADFQVAFRVPEGLEEPAHLHVTVDDASAPFTQVRRVVSVPCQAVKQQFDDHYLRRETGRYPDLLTPVSGGVVTVSEPGWHSVWLTVRLENISDAGPRPVTVTVTQDGATVLEQTVLINVLPRHLPSLPIAHTEWFHLDSLAEYYDVPVFSEAHWEIIDRFLASAAAMDVNTILTPLWTPPLDTAVGSYRTPVQLIDIRVDEGRYSFDFSRLQRWLALCRRHGITRLEVPHFFTQWGARFTPAFYAQVDGVTQRVFGWDVAATDPRYREFLEALVPAVIEALSRHWDLSQVYFHISDEPHGEEHTASYQAARDVVAPLLRGLHLIDALSDLDLYTQGLVRTPVAANDAIEPFLKAGVEPLWTYYCVAQQKEVSNRFINQPLIRARVLASQLYKFRLGGFLHWGFNFYFSELSTHLVDPFLDTTAGGAFPGGDPFIVYPGPGGTPLESVRYRTIAAAMADLRAMHLLEQLYGRAAVLEIIDPDDSLTMTSFSYDADTWRRMREQVNAAIMRG